MKVISLYSTLFFASLFPLLAIDVQPSKQVVPPKFIDPGGKRLDLMTGDPKRIEKANKINFKDLESKIEISPAILTLKNGQPLDSAATIQVTFNIKNHGKKTYTLSFPNSQRIDIIIKNAAGMPVYVWSADKEFSEEPGAVLINNDDRLSYNESIPVTDLAGFAPGTYTVEAVLGNYPLVNAHGPFTIAP